MASCIKVCCDKLGSGRCRCPPGIAGPFVLGQLNRLRGVRPNGSERAADFLNEWIAAKQQLNVHQVIIDAHLVQVLPGEVNLSGVDGEVESRLGGSELALPLAAAWIAVAMTGNQYLRSFAFRLVELIDEGSENVSPAVHGIIQVSGSDGPGSLWLVGK